MLRKIWKVRCYCLTGLSECWSPIQPLEKMKSKMWLQRGGSVRWPSWGGNQHWSDFPRPKGSGQPQVRPLLDCLAKKEKELQHKKDFHPVDIICSCTSSYKRNCLIAERHIYRHTDKQAKRPQATPGQPSPQLGKKKKSSDPWGKKKRKFQWTENKFTYTTKNNYK